MQRILAGSAFAVVLLAANGSFAQGYPPPQQYPPQQYPPQQYPPQQYPPQQYPAQYPPQQYPPQQYPPQQYPPQQYPPQQYPPQQYPPQQYPPQQYPPQQYPPQPPPQPPPQATPQPPPPPKSNELSWSIRVNPLDLLWGRANGMVEYAPFYPLSIGIGPQYVFGDVLGNDIGAKVSGGGIFAELGLWLEGRPLRGWFIKGHLEYTSLKLVTEDPNGNELSNLTIPKRLIGALFGAQHLIGSVFTYQWGIGLAYDMGAKEREITYWDNGKAKGILPKSGPLENGLDLITQLGIGVSF